MFVELASTDIESQLAEAMRDGLAVFDPSGRLVQWNSSARAITGWTPGLAARRGLGGLPAGVVEIHEGKWIDVRHFNATEDGVPCTAVVFSDVSAQVSLRAAYRQIEDLVLTDAVTALPNRRLALGQATRAIALARRDLRAVGLLTIDIDEFARVNHHVGLSEGDELLREVGWRIAGEIRGSDMCARTGGDEFSAVLTAMARPSDAAIVAVRMLLALATPYHVGDEQRTVGVSVGVASYPGDGEDAESLFRASNVALAAAKSAGGGCYRDYRELRHRASAA